MDPNVNSNKNRPVTPRAREGESKTCSSHAEAILNVASWHGGKAIFWLPRRVSAVLLAGVVGMAGATHASQILAPLSGNGGISLNASPASYVTTPSPGNYPTLSKSVNELYYNETVNTTTGGTANFNGGTENPTEYFVRLDVVNNTGVPWYGYNVTTYGSFQNPRLNQHQSTYIFDYTPAPSISQIGGTVSSPDDNLMEFRNILVPHGGSMRLEFELALPVVGAGGWYIDQYPITNPIPEPTALFLSLAAIGALAIVRPRRQLSQTLICL